MVVHKGVGVMSEMIRVLLVEPGKHPRLVEVEHTLRNLQKLVGGDIQAVYPWASDLIGLVCDDAGKLKPENKPNRLLEVYDLLVGPFFLCGLGQEDFISISDELALKYAKKFWMPETFLRTPRGLLVIRDWDGGSEPGKEWLNEVHRPFDE
jgi:hypothetical protein